MPETRFIRIFLVTKDRELNNLHKFVECLARPF